MYCSYHPANAAQALCKVCGRSLCAACDHRIKGLPYCQDCIVLGIDTLSRQHYQARPSKRKARLAALCGLLPGMGAVYNRQNFKGVIHFITIVGLFEASDITSFGGLFALAGTTFYLYSIIDAYRTAQLIAQGESASVSEERFKRSLIKRAPVIGLALISMGLVLFLQIVQPFGIAISLTRLLPVALIILGGYLLTRYFKRSREEGYSYDPSQQPPYSLTEGSFGERGHQSTGRTFHSGDHR